MPELPDDLAACFGEHLAEPAALLVTEGVVLADGRDLAVTVFVGPIAQWVREGAGRIAGDAHDVLDALALGEIIGGDDRDKIGRAVLLDVVGHGETGVGEQVAYQERYVCLFNELAGFLQRGIRIGAVVLDDQLDLAAGHFVAGLIEPELRAFHHLAAARGDHSGQRRQDADLDRASLGARAPR